MREAAQTHGYAAALSVLVVTEWLYLDWASRAPKPLPDNFVHAEWIGLHDSPGFRAFVHFLRAELDRAGFVSRHPDPADRRRTIVEITPAQSTLISRWLDGAANPLARVLDKLAPSEQQAFLKAMDMLETELHMPETKG